ncbi:hypothetical protein B2J93_2449 [Marssonina coronariae]|uniref:Uncharacterized protein n=1 Tax=Diplocarpon coronariae TaxID=2795749 RepID=A0A218YXP9_9HELO|nr:hypothetical protein B2J93_2449 [Marssonina coronariae]
MFLQENATSRPSARAGHVDCSPLGHSANALVYDWTLSRHVYTAEPPSPLASPVADSGLIVLRQSSQVEPKTSSQRSGELQVPSISGCESTAALNPLHVHDTSSYTSGAAAYVK